MIDPKQLLQYVVAPTLAALQMDSVPARKLVMGTIAQESLLGRYLHQKGGPAMGICQIEMATCKDIIVRYLSKRPKLAERFDHATNCEAYGGVRDWSSLTDDEISQLLHTDMRFQVAVCRLKYWPVPQALGTTLDEIALYWDTYYNANPDHGTVEEFKMHYHKFKLEDLFRGL